jgi:hypothetical protein
MPTRRRPPYSPDIVLDAFDMIAAAAGLPKDVVIDEWKERAAIREYLGGFPRGQAERLALDDAERYFVPQRELF